MRLPRWAEHLREELCNHAEKLAIEAGIEIEFIRCHHAFRKEARIMAIIAERGTHHYFYFIDEAFGLCYLRVPTWAPFRLQVYFNGHHWLAQQLLKARILFKMADNVFLSIADPTQAQTMADQLDAKQLHRRLNRCANRFCPVVKRYRSGYLRCFR